MVVFCYSICLFRHPVTTILKVVDCEDCLRENKLPLEGPGSEAPSCWQFLLIFWNKIAILMTFCRFLEQLEKAKLLRFGKV